MFVNLRKRPTNSLSLVELDMFYQLSTTFMTKLHMFFHFHESLVELDMFYQLSTTFMTKLHMFFHFH
ncbi:hypothetical protein ACJX0J_028464, partial [Zea mays]